MTFTPRTLRCGGCNGIYPIEEMHEHVAKCEGWISYEGHDLADLARDAGFDVKHERPSWFARVILRRKERYVI